MNFRKKETEEDIPTEEIEYVDIDDKEPLTSIRELKELQEKYWSQR